DGSEQCQQRFSEEIQVVHGVVENKGNFECISQGPLDKPEKVVPNSSNCGAKTNLEGDKEVDATVEEIAVRGLSTSFIADRRVGEEVEIGVDLVGPTDEGFKERSNPFILDGGPKELGHLPVEQNCTNGLGSDNEERAITNLDSGPDKIQISQQEELGPGGLVIAKLDDLVREAHDKNQAPHLICCSQEDSNVSSSASSLPDKDVSKQTAKIKKPMSHIPLPQMGGPKCLHFAEVVNSASNRRKRGIKSINDGGSASKNSRYSNKEVIKSTSELSDKEAGESEYAPTTANTSSQSHSQSHMEANQSGLNFILGDKTINDVDGFEANRNESIVKTTEAEILLEIQSDLGLNFDTKEPRPVSRMVMVEGRDRENLEGCEEPQCFQ
ncbi:hypothetical protein A2U01_0015170, partial [Trifolium medium]|nr:hypothetical protein [Trifolium medium]